MGMDKNRKVPLSRQLAVVAENDPAIHAFASRAAGIGNRVDARIKPAHDDLRLSPDQDTSPLPFLNSLALFAGVTMTIVKINFISGQTLKD